MLFKKKQNSEKLATKSQAIVGVFTKTIDDLREVNSKIVEHREQQLREKERLEAELQHLDDTHKGNVSVIENIGKLFPQT